MIDRTFIDELASSAPTPGGGGASAYCGALASALASMVANLTVGKKKYADVEADMIVMLEKLATVRERLLELVEEDAEAFNPLAAAYRMPKSTPEEEAAKNAALQAALADACEVPLEIMRTCARVVEMSEFLAQHGSRLALFAKAALNGASLNVFANVVSMDDKERAGAYRHEAITLMNVWSERADMVFARVLNEIRRDTAAQ